MIRVVAAIVECQQRLLICQRRRDALFALQWEFPGGKIQAGETPEAALVREVREELGVEARIGREVYRVHHRYSELAEEIEVIFFAASIPERVASVTSASAASRNATVASTKGALCALPKVRNLVFERISWARRSELRRYDFLPADRPLVDRLVRGDFQEITAD